MKRLVTTLLLAGSGLAAMAQAPFTIFRPADGAKVREMVHVLIPVKSVPADGYLGIFINGKFVEATLPALDASKKYYEYDLDTKARGVPDGQLTLEAVLYVDFQDKPRIVDRSSVQVTVANTADNTIPAGGLKLAYKWTPGTQMVYDYTSTEVLSQTDAQAQAIGGRPDTISHELERFRIVYACDNAFPDGSGLVRMQALPLKGKESIMVTTIQSPDTPEKFDRDQLYPLYEHLKSDGLELWGSMPFNLPMEGTAGGGPTEILYADRPLPTLPDKPVHVGSFWSARFQFGHVPSDSSTWNLLGSFVEHYPARGEFKGIEWEMGHPCAKIVDKIEMAVASEEATKGRKAGDAITGNKLSETETIWFALDKHQILRIEREESQDQQVAVENGFGGASGAAGADSGGSKVAGPPPPPSGLLAGGQRQLPPPPSSDYQQSAGPPPPPGALQGGSGGGGLGRGGRSGGGQARTKLVRMTHKELYVLEL